jgi:hypothetical protein
MLDSEFKYGAEIPWSRAHSSEQQWDDVAVWSIEQFGLPGDRFVTDVNVNDMTFWFKTPQDRLIFLLRNGQARCLELC